MTDVPAAPRAPSRFAREITAAILSPLAIWIIGWAPNPVFDGTVFVIGTLALYEFLVLGQRKGYSIPIVICIAAMLFIVAAFILEPISVEMGVFLALLVIRQVSTLFVVSLSALLMNILRCSVSMPFQLRTGIDHVLKLMA